MNALRMNTAGATLSNALKDESVTGYAGNVTPMQAYDCLISEPALLLDVRTLPEWQFTGLPDLRSQGIATHCISWKTYPNFQANPDFIAQVSALTTDKHMPIFFMCRSGGRSADAATAMTQAGYTACFNISGGFEGEPDASGKRGTKEGWKACQLSWSQT